VCFDSGGLLTCAGKVTGSFKILTELPRPLMGLATFQMSFGRQLYCEADFTDDLGRGCGLQGFLSSGALERSGLFPGTLSGRLDGLGRVDLRTLLSGSGAFDWGWNHLGCCLSRTGLESLGLLSFSDCLGRHTDGLLFHLMAPIHSRTLKGSTKLAGRRTLLSGSGAFDWGWTLLGCCLSRTGLESLGLLSFSDCLGRHTDGLLFHLMAHWRALKGSTKLAGRDRGVSVQLSKRSGMCLFS
jgi:hypothetical protein